MPAALDKLLQIASPALAPAAPSVPADLLAQPGAAALGDLLGRRNGFYAFESALHVFPVGSEGTQDLAGWNAPGLWRDAYGGLADGLLLFAEDLFGGQFALRDGEVVTFEPETGEVEALARDLEGWARALLDDYELLTGQPLAHAWQRRHGPLPAGRRLLPKTPFVLGGAYEVENLYPLEAVQGMRLRGDIARQLKDLPDGARVRLTTGE
jgi:hypothetical protein